MRKLDRVMVGVDYSAPARAAFEYALALSRRHGAELSVVHVVPSDTPFKWHARERVQLIGALRAAAQSAGVRFKVSVDQGDPARVLLLHARTRLADLLVLGASERVGFDRWRFGSVADTVVREATGPVMVVPVTGTRVDPSAPARSILAAVDLGDGARAAVESALTIAGDDTRVTVLHVVPGVPLAHAASQAYHRMEAEYRRLLTVDAWQRIAEIVPPAASARVHARVAVGDPTAEISRIAGDVDADLVLVGVTPRGAIGRLLFGSTAARVIRAAGVPVLAMPQPREPFRAPLPGDEQFAAAA